MYSFGRRKTYNPFIGRFRKEDINEGIYKLCKNLPGVIIEVEVLKEQYDKAKEMIKHFTANSHLYKYNYKGLLYNLLNKPVCSNHRFLCSEFVYHILKESGTVDLNISRNLVRPQSLLNVGGRIIYKGNLKKIKIPNNDFNTKKIRLGELSAI